MNFSNGDFLLRFLIRKNVPMPQSNTEKTAALAKIIAAAFVKRLSGSILIIAEDSGNSQFPLGKKIL